MAEPKLRLIKAIIVANELKDRKLDVKNHSSFSSWNRKTDELWLRYSKAMNIISRYKTVKFILTKLGIL